MVQIECIHKNKPDFNFKSSLNKVWVERELAVPMTINFGLHSRKQGLQFFTPI